MLCRIAEGQSGGQREKGRWREYLLPSLAEKDVTLANKLWNKVFNSVDELLHFFSEDATERGWSKEVLLEWGIDKFMNAHRLDMDIGRIISSYPKLLANGAICRTLEYGTENDS